MLCLVATVAGVATGFVGGAFRWCLERATDGRDEVLDWAHPLPGPGWLVPMLLAAAGAALARAIVIRVPLASGSGVQHVEAAWREEVQPPTWRILPAKFVGGVLALGSGLVLGREGPTVQMGAAIGAEAGRRARVSDADVRLLQASLAGAGLGVAFNAPLGGALFVLEEVTKSFRRRLVLVALIGSAVAVTCSRVLVGDAFTLPVTALPSSPSLGVLAALVVFGLLTGALGAAYNRLILGILHVTDRIAAPHPVVFAALVGATIGLILFLDPFLGAEGDTLTQRVLTGSNLGLWVLAGYLVVRFVVGPLSYSTGVPGGLFSPLLALGAVWGALCFGVADAMLPSGATATTFAVTGMAAFFTAVVRAPVTGIVLIVEMTGAAELTAGMLAACFAATLSATLLRSAPIYDPLRVRMERPPASAR